MDLKRLTLVAALPLIGLEHPGAPGMTPVMPVNRFSCEAFIARKGRIPAPHPLLQELRGLTIVAQNAVVVTLEKVSGA